MLNLMLWLIEHTSINSSKTTANKDIIKVFNSNSDVEINNLGFHIGSYLKIIYGNDLEKTSTDPTSYNIEVHEEPIKQVEIKQLY